MIEPPTTWSVTGGKLRLWRGRAFMGEVERDHFPALIMQMAQELRYPSEPDGPRLALVPTPDDAPLG